MIKKILLLGSAGYVKDWYSGNGAKFLRNGFQLCAMNNAWAVDPDNLRVWFHAEDYSSIPTSKIPSDMQRQKFVEITRWNDVPFFYTNRRGGTMLLNVLCHILNENFMGQDQVFIAIAGADQTYTGEPSKDYYYGQGTPDPMKFGKEFIAESLQHIKYASEKLGHTIVNSGGQAETLLPFARYSL